jgi:hypothetical protein
MLIVRVSTLQNTLTIVLRDPASLRARQRPWVARLRLLLQRGGLISTHVVIGDATLSTPISAIMAAIRRHYHRGLDRYHILVVQPAN